MGEPGVCRGQQCHSAWGSKVLGSAMGSWGIGMRTAWSTPGLGEVLLSIPGEIRVPETACARACACQGGLLCRFLVRNAMRPGCGPCVSPAKSLRLRGAPGGGIYVSASNYLNGLGSLWCREDELCCAWVGLCTCSQQKDKANCGSLPQCC